jgi:CRP-like cAMP-binding protein
MQTTKLSANGKDHIVKLVTKGELLGQRSMISDEPVNLSAVARRICRFVLFQSRK